MLEIKCSTKLHYYTWKLRSDYSTKNNYDFCFTYDTTFQIINFNVCFHPFIKLWLTDVRYHFIMVSGINVTPLLLNKWYISQNLLLTILSEEIYVLSYMFTILFQVLLSIILYLEIDSSHQRFALYIIIVQVLMAIWPVINIDSALNLLNTLQYFTNRW